MPFSESLLSTLDALGSVVVGGRVLNESKLLAAKLITKVTDKFAGAVATA